MATRHLLATRYEFIGERQAMDVVALEMIPGDFINDANSAHEDLTCLLCI
jgi:hypothetical protein